MHLSDIAWASVRRRPGRLVFMLVGLALGLGTVVTLVTLADVMHRQIADELDRFGANIVITPKVTALDVAYGGTPVAGVTIDAAELSTDDVVRVRTIHHHRNLAAVVPRLLGVADIDGRRVLLVGLGLDQAGAVKPWWRVDGRAAGKPDEVMLGADAAQVLGISIGDTVRLDGATRRVTGVLRPTGAIEDRAILTDLGVAQAVLHRPGAVSYIEVSALCTGCPIEAIVQQIAAVLPNARVSPIRQALAARDEALRQFVLFSWVVSAVVLLVGGLVVVSTMMASVTDRTQEIGVLRAIGFRQRQVATIVLIEAVAVNVLAGFSGWAIGTIAARLTAPLLAHAVAPTVPDVRLAGLAIGLAVVIGAAGGAYPALRAARLDPVQALRHL